jgi:neutral ceramidase
MVRILLLFCFGLGAVAADYRAGTAAVDITPDGPVWMAGYASRTKPSTGVLQRLRAKALAIEDRKGGRIVIVTTDLLGLPRVLTDAVGARVVKELNVPRERVLFNSSHTHTGPVVRPNLSIMYNLSAEDAERVREYSQMLAGKLFDVVGAALGDLKPAGISFGTGTVGFAANRRQRGSDGAVRIGVNQEGPVDHSVPVLRVDDERGNPRAVIFGYACHNTTLTGEHYQISGDYAGFAQAEIENSLPGTTALFLALCGGDQNPNPRSREEHVLQHGRTLAAEVRRVMGATRPVRGETRGALQWRDLPLQPHDRGDFETMLAASDPIRVRFAKSMLALYDERRPMRTVSFPVQALRIGKDMAVVALGGEPVVEYALRAKAAHPKLRLIVAGYSNDVMGYVPTAKMLTEGGYEPVSSALYYGLAMPFTPDVERLVNESVDAVLKRVMR